LTAETGSEERDDELRAPAIGTVPITAYVVVAPQERSARRLMPG
jgi:hypothetical protein